MKNSNKILYMILCSSLITACVCSCGNSSNSNTDETNITKDISSDTDAAPDVENATLITENTVTTITKGGTYVVAGEISNGRIIVNAPKEEVTLVLDNASITCSYGSPIYVYDAALTTIYLKEGTENTLTDGDTYTFDDSFSSAADVEPNACLYSKSDLIINGEGKLNVSANFNNGITGDTLQIEDASVSVTAKKHCINGKDSCILTNAAIEVTSGTDGDCLRSTKGNLKINGGTYTISADDDGIHALGNVEITDGTITITKSNEGIEGSTIDISGGTINITSNDDGINAANSSDGSASEYYISISGGEISVNAGTDGLDSNGNITVSGGKIYISGAENNGDSALDYDGTAVITGGIFVATGFSGMAQNFGNASTQGCILLTYQTASTEPVSLKDTSGNILAEYTPCKSYNCVIISCPDIKDGSTYTVTACNETSTITMDGLIYGTGLMSPNGMQNPNGQTPHGGMQLPDGQTPHDGMQLPDGQTPPDGMQLPDGQTPPDGMQNPDGQTPHGGMQLPDGQTPPDGMQLPDGQTPPDGMQLPDGQTPPDGMQNPNNSTEAPSSI
ncbi:MAG: carbohydrate-binding domain-containing protein [Clostridium sp.]|nr:carbohydrate-binding domain-containing protein [Clostridium sp.]MCM1399977.1 carbohydrate-binding domain-containing protein [Clostridium sp.]MCM1460281.1 carbohydrate-binding domain-containing protein [Bacteroides sp.]